MQSDPTEAPFEAPEHVAQAPVAAGFALGVGLAPGPTLDSGVVLALQRSAGNCSVSRLLADSAAPAAAPAAGGEHYRALDRALARSAAVRLNRCPGRACGGACECTDEDDGAQGTGKRARRGRGGAMGKVQGDEDEFAPEEEAGDDRVNVLTVETGGEGAGAGSQASAGEAGAEAPATGAPAGAGPPATGATQPPAVMAKRNGQAVTVSVEAGAEPAGREFAHHASPDFAKCGATAAASISAGAAPTHALAAGMYGLTFPESVDVTITACKEGSNWVPGVLTLVGRYSMQTRLLPGQSEVTGPGGNTTKTNFCDQVSGLKALGNRVGNPWYMVSAVVAHEQVHESRFLPALNAVSAKIVAAVEAVGIPDDGKMAEADALKALQANAAFKAAVKTAYTTWLAEAARRVAGDHAGGGPTDKAEQAIVGPMIASICAEGKKSSWGACPACPP